MNKIIKRYQRTIALCFRHCRDCYEKGEIPVGILSSSTCLFGRGCELKVKEKQND